MRSTHLVPSLLVVLAACYASSEVAPKQVATTLRIFPESRVAALSMWSSVHVPIVLLDQNGSELPMPPGLTFVSRDTTVVAVESGNWLRTRGPGITRLVAWVPVGERVLTDSMSFSVSCTLELIVGFTPPSMTLSAGETATASFHTSSCGGYYVNNGPWKWSSATPSIASVDSLSGLVTAVATGSVRISVHQRASGSRIADFTVTVR